MALTLYVVGGHEPSRRAEERLRAILDESGPLNYLLQVVDLNDDPQRAEDDRILACPTVIRHTPHPIRRIVGDLRSADQVRKAIGIG